ncbi:MAG: hypothetical protein QM765_41710 [Myxococcales bacterium]
MRGAAKGTPAKRWLLFFFYAAIVCAGLGANAAGIRLALRILGSPAFWAPKAPCLSCAVAVLAVGSAYALWLSGTTLAGWRMPRAVHLVPVLLLAATIFGGPLQRAPDLAQPPLPPERTMEAMDALRSLVAASRTCAAPASKLEEALSAHAQPSGFRRFGFPSPWRVVVVEQPGPVKEVRAGDAPGTLLLSCEPGTRRFWISGVTSDALPIGAATMVRDGVGRAAVLAAEVSP